MDSKTQIELVRLIKTLYEEKPSWWTQTMTESFSHKIQHAIISAWKSDLLERIDVAARKIANIPIGCSIKQNRKPFNILYRSAFFYAYRIETCLSLEAIGSIFDKDHATVLHNIKKFKDNLLISSELRSQSLSAYRSSELNKTIESIYVLFETKKLKENHKF